MLERLPKFIDPLVFADRGSELKGEIELTEFERLADILANQNGNVGVQFSFFKQNRLAVLKGQVNVDIDLVCQKCLEAVHWNSQISFDLGLVGSMDEADRLPEGYEPMLVKNEEKIALSTIVEEELLLTIPAFPKHEHNCSNIEQNKNNNTITRMETTNTNNPFSVLAKLKKTGD
jgi:uncharacterized protein